MHTVKRLCIACRQKQPKANLLRINKSASGVFDVSDGAVKTDGRGCYVCNTSECIAKVVKTRQLNKSFRCNIPNEIYEKLCKK